MLRLHSRRSSTRGVLHACDLRKEAKTDDFVSPATSLDDGEAMCLATQLGVTPVTMPKLVVKQRGEQSKATEANIASVLHRNQAFARFVPRRNSPFHAWWTKHTTKRKT